MPATLFRPVSNDSPTATITTTSTSMRPRSSSSDSWSSTTSASSVDSVLSESSSTSASSASSRESVSSASTGKSVSSSSPWGSVSPTSTSSRGLAPASTPAPLTIPRSPFNAHRTGGRSIPSISFSPGEILWLGAFDPLHPIRNLHADAYNHPVLVLSAGKKCDSGVIDIEVCICTTLKNTPLTIKYRRNPNRRRHYLPLENPHPDRSDRPTVSCVRRDAPTVPRTDRETYVNAHVVYRVNSWDLQALRGKGNGWRGRSWLEPEGLAEVNRWLHPCARKRGCMEGPLRLWQMEELEARERIRGWR